MFQFDPYSPSVDADPFPETVRRGQVAEHGFPVSHFRRDVLIGFDSAKQPPVHMLARKPLDAGISPTPAQGCRCRLDFAGIPPISASSVTGGEYLGDKKRALLHCEITVDERILSYLEMTEVSR